MTSPEKIVVTDDDVKPVVVDVGHQLPPVTAEHVLGGARDVLAGGLSRDASPRLVESETEAAREVLRENS
jgi:hypothetical protein